MEFKTVAIEYIEPHIAVISLNVPKKFNAVSFEMFAELEQSLHQV